MTNQDMIAKLHKDFPEHTFKIAKLSDQENFEKREYLAIDGGPSIIHWTRIENFSGSVETEKALYGLITGEIMTYFLQHQGKI